MAFILAFPNGGLFIGIVDPYSVLAVIRSKARRTRLLYPVA